MTPERVWLVQVTAENRRRLTSALEPLGWPLHPLDADAISGLTPGGGLELMIRETPASGTGPGETAFPTLWILAPGGVFPAPQGPGPHEFLRLPAPREEIVARAYGLLRATYRERALQRYERESIEQLERRRGMVRTIAHDMMSPLTAVMEYLELLLDGTVGEPSEVQRKLLTEAQGAARRVHERIEEIVDAHRAELGMPIPVKLQRTDMAQILSALQEWAVPLFRARRHELVLHLEPDTPPICGDPDRLEQILRLLMEQAQRGAARGARIEVGVAQDPDATGFVRFTVATPRRDRGGPGSDSSSRSGPGPAIAVTASELNASDARRLESGIGLVGALAQAMGGELLPARTEADLDRRAFRIPAWGSRAARIAQVQTMLASAGDLPGGAWVWRVMESALAVPALDAGIRTLQRLSEGESLAVAAEEPPAGWLCVGRVRDLREPGSLYRALQPRLRIQMVQEKRTAPVIPG